MKKTHKTILVIAGEESGDMRAAPLLREVRRQSPNTRFIGIAGDHCRAEGMELFANIEDLAVVGFVEVLLNFSRIKKIFDLTLKKILQEKPDLALLIDYPGFNLRLAKHLKKNGIKVIFYVSPQIWAWKKDRVHLIKKVVDRMMVLFSFEKDIYAQYNYKADFVGHPLIDEVHASQERSSFLTSLNLSAKKITLGLLPGSRSQEIHNLLPHLLEAAHLLRHEMPDLQILLLRAKSVKDKDINPILDKAPSGMIITQDYYNALNAVDAAIVASGTATLEAGILEKPMVIVYKTTWLTAAIVRLLVKIPFISLVNIIAGKKIVEELLQERVNSKAIHDEIYPLLNKTPVAEEMKVHLSQLRLKLGQQGASQRASQVILEELASL